MIRAKLKFVRQIVFAALLMGFLVCSAEVGVRIYECASGQSICLETESPAPSDPSALAVPSWLCHLELKPHATAEIKSRDQRRTIEIQTNSLGLRSPELTIPKPADVFRIIVLGDETVYAPEIADSDHFLGLLARSLGQQTRLRIEVVNAGIPEACPLTEYLLFKHKLLTLQPNLVLVHYDWSDVNDDRQLRRRLSTDSQGTALSCPHTSLQRSTAEPHALDRLRDQFRLVHWGFQSLGQHWQRQIHQQAAISRDADTNAYAWMRQPHPETDVAVTQSFQPLTDLARLSRGAYCPMIVFTSPKPWQISARCANGPGTRMHAGVSADACYPSRAPFEALAQFAAQHQIPLADLSQALTHPGPAEANFLRYSPRWSAAGHRVVAETLAAMLREHVAGPWNSRYFQPETEAARENSPGAVRWASGIQ